MLAAYHADTQVSRLVDRASGKAQHVLVQPDALRCDEVDSMLGFVRTTLCPVKLERPRHPVSLQLWYRINTFPATTSMWRRRLGVVWTRSVPSDERKQRKKRASPGNEPRRNRNVMRSCLLYTSDAADDLLCVDLGGR